MAFVVGIPSANWGIKRCMTRVSQIGGSWLRIVSAPLPMPEHDKRMKVAQDITNMVRTYDEVIARRDAPVIPPMEIRARHGLRRTANPVGILRPRRNHTT